MVADLAPASAAPARRHATFHPLRVSLIEPLTADSVAITFEVPPELRSAYDFTQGQHLTLRTRLGGQEVRRNYSICAPAGSGRLRVAVKRLPGGAFSAYAHDSLQPGDVVDVMTPTGRFHVPLDPTARRHYCALVAGSGITPVLSILSTTLAAEPRSEFTLIYGNRTLESVMFLEELQDLKDRYPDRLQLLHVLSREPRESELLSGRLDPAKVQRLLTTVVPVADVDEWFLCGPFAMVEAARSTLLEQGVQARRLHLELFHVEGETPRERAAEAAVDAADQSQVTAMLDGRSTTFAVSRSGTRILDALLAVRSDAPYACKGGVCGTCRAKVVSGEVTMERNYALEDSEIAAGFVLTCQSHPVSDRVTVDYDA
jgi:ring-1,2-phenylacetyl-CoA epoxidase subunit PaaE